MVTKFHSKDYPTWEELVAQGYDSYEEYDENTVKGALAEIDTNRLFVKHGWVTFTPPPTLKPIQDLVAIRGNDVRLIQVKAGRVLKSTCAYKDTNGVKPGAIWASFPGCGLDAERRRKKYLDIINRKIFLFSTLAIGWEDEIALFDDPSLWCKGSIRLSIDTDLYDGIPFHDNKEPEWLLRENASSVATEPKLSVAI